MKYWKTLFPVVFVCGLLLLTSEQLVHAQFAPVLVGSANDGTSASGLVLRGSYAYVANGSDGLRIYNVSNPTNPIGIGHVSNGGFAYAVTVANNYAYLANGSDGLRIYDVSNPTNPVNVGHTNDVQSFDRASAIAIRSNYVYLAIVNDGIHIYDVSDPLHPTNVKHTITGGLPHGITVSGDRCYVADYTGGLHVYDISNPTNFILLGTGGISDANAVVVSGNYAYVANGAYPLVIYDISNATNVNLISYTTNLYGQGYALDLAISGNYAYIADNSAHMRIFDVSNPANPIWLAQSDESGSFFAGVSVSNNYAYAVNGGLRIFSLDLQLSISSTSSNTLLFSWPGSTFVSTLQQITDLSQNNWVSLTNISDYDANGDQFIVLPKPTFNRFYRLKYP